ncbi:hypothetical protein ROHU_001361 [Labeo rohita]|uniref:Uncharacterized protein n=1 Tax=Labeo rohita TaxID=84645 RepID=A0A498P288_LABRO|nr:hypothetical protein ROHU_029544 [Labeo rohita]RXN38178.1 hypothetical protein ROHU_001361 [Labeo rohita]
MMMEDASLSFKYTYDFDGIVVELSGVSCLKAGLHYLFVGNVDGSRVASHWHLLKKHLDLSLYTAESVNALKKSVGIVLAYVDGGYFLNASCLPVNPNRAHPMFRIEMMAKAHAIGLLNALFHHFCNRLRNVPPADLERPSIMKTNLSNPGRMNILHEDQEFLLKLFQESVETVNCDVDMCIVLSLTKFGQKDDRRFDLSTLVDKAGVVSVSYHAADVKTQVWICFGQEVDCKRLWGHVECCILPIP